jgi:hypothetical protein
MNAMERKAIRMESVVFDLELVRWSILVRI